MFGAPSSGFYNPPPPPVAPPGLDAQTKGAIEKDCRKLSTLMTRLVNEPSNGMYFVQTHIHMSLPKMVEMKHEIQKVTTAATKDKLDTEDSIQVVQAMKELNTFDNVQRLLTRSIVILEDMKRAASQKPPSLSPIRPPASSLVIPSTATPPPPSSVLPSAASSSEPSPTVTFANTVVTPPSQPQEEGAEPATTSEEVEDKAKSEVMDSSEENSKSSATDVPAKDEATNV